MLDKNILIGGNVTLHPVSAPQPLNCLNHAPRPYESRAVFRSNEPRGLTHA